MFTVDTNVIIYFLEGDEDARRMLIDEMGNVPIFVSTITESELFSYPRLTEIDEKAIETFLAKTILIPVDSRLARIAAAFRRRERHLRLGDSFIAATAATTRSTLLTRNIRDFRSVPEILVQKV